VFYDKETFLYLVKYQKVLRQPGGDGVVEQGGVAKSLLFGDDGVCGIKKMFFKRTADVR
jgi:hypothetical protein